MHRATRSAVVAATFAALLVATGGAAAKAAEPATPPHDQRRVLVAFRPGTPGGDRAAAHARQGGRVENRMEWLRLDVVRLRNGDSPVAAAARYRRNPNVEYAHPNWQVRNLQEPNDPLFPRQWGLHNTGASGGKADADVDAPEGWDLAYGTAALPSSRGARVGVLDTGIDRTHADMAGKTAACASAITGVGVVLAGSCTDDNGHGTHVAGTIAALTDNRTGVAGVAPDAELAVFKALNAAGVGFYADVIKGVHWLRTAGAARVISMSIGGPRDTALDRELTEAAKAGVLLVAAAGNDGDATLNYPAAHADVLSVAATDHSDRRASFSNCNSDVELAAPGVKVLSTWPGGTYLALSGTSMATPHVSGAAAVLFSALPNLTAAQAHAALTSGADDLGDSGRDWCYGHGRLNMQKAVAAARLAQ